MGPAVYALCMFTSALCAGLLWREYRKSRTPLLFWSALSFFGWTANNVLVFSDLVLFPEAINLAGIRALVALLAIALLLYGLVWDAA